MTKRNMQSNPKRAQRRHMRVLKTSMARRRNIAHTELESMDHTMTRDTIHIGNMTNMLRIHIGRNMTNMLRIHIGQEPKRKERKKMRKNHIGHMTNMLQIHIGRHMTNMLRIHIGRNMTNMLRIHIGQVPKTKERKKMRKNRIGHMTNMLRIHIGRNMTNMLRIPIGQEPKTKERKKMRKNHIGHIMRELHIGQNMTNMLPNRHIGQHWILERTWTWAPFDCRELPNR